ncbi:MAG: hypothetical protein M1819_002116 [Sarea resinae]|nr:MAG: hypothetical protein M1819_002116 [Sarea resinae]
MHPESDVDKLLQRSEIQSEAEVEGDASDSDLSSFSRSSTGLLASSGCVGQELWGGSPHEGYKPSTTDPAIRGSPPRVAWQHNDIPKRQFYTAGQSFLDSSASQGCHLANNRSVTALEQVSSNAASIGTRGRPSSIGTSVSGQPLSADRLRPHGAQSTDRHNGEATRAAAQSQDPQLFDDSLLRSLSEIAGLVTAADSEKNDSAGPSAIASALAERERASMIEHDRFGKDEVGGGRALELSSRLEQQVLRIKSGLESLLNMKTELSNLPGTEGNAGSSRGPRKGISCTFANKGCYKAFGSKNDWKQHENVRHFQQEA